MNSSRNTIKSLKEIFAVEGFPEVIVSDNGPQFTAEEFRIFCNSNGIKPQLLFTLHQMDKLKDLFEHSKHQ